MPTIEDQLREAGAAWRDHVDAMPRPARPTTSYAAQRRRGAVRRRVATLVVAAAAAAAFVGLGVLAAPQLRPGTAGADCAAPELAVPGTGAAVVVHPGQTVTVSGRYFVTACYDSGPRRDPPPYGTVTLSLEGATREVRLATVHPDHDGDFTATVRIPADFPTGPATLGADSYATRAVRLDVTRATSSRGPQSSSSTNR